MLIQFKTSDGAVWLVDTMEGKWARVSKPVTPRWTGMAEPPVVAAAVSREVEGNKDGNKSGVLESESEVLESGALVPQGYGVYAMEGRTPKSPAPGAGLCTVAVMPVAMGTVLHLFLRANVPVTDFTMPRPIETVRYEVVPTQGGDDAGQQEADSAPGPQEPAQPGTAPGKAPGGKRPKAETGLGPGGEEVAQQVSLQGAIAGEIPQED